MPDARYLAEALDRAGRDPKVGSLEVKELVDGRQSDKVVSLKTDAGSYVVKIFPHPNWRDAVFGEKKGEVALWRSGVTRGLPEPVMCPTIDVFFNEETNEEWMLMDDVSAGIMPRGAYDEEKIKWLLRGLASLHAEYWGKDEELTTLPLISLETHVDFITKPIACLGGRIPATGWIGKATEHITVLKPLVPIFLEELGDDAEWYLDLCEHSEKWVSRLSKFPHTFAHGDIRRANVAPLSKERVALFDWDMAMKAPAATDLAWFWFLHFWCYPPDERDISEREVLRQYYIEELAARIPAFDRQEFEAAWQLSWLKVFVELGFCLVDPLVGNAPPEKQRHVRENLKRAVEEANNIISMQGIQ